MIISHRIHWKNMKLKINKIQGNLKGKDIDNKEGKAKKVEEVSKKNWLNKMSY